MQVYLPESLTLNCTSRHGPAKESLRTQLITLQKVPILCQVLPTPSSLGPLLTPLPFFFFFFSLSLFYFSFFLHTFVLYLFFCFPFVTVYWNRTLATEEGLLWNFTKVTPDVVIVLLGTNDYYAWPYPSQGQFVSGYINMLKRIVGSYSYLPVGQQPTIINLCGGTLDNDRAPCDNVQAASKAFASNFYQDTHYVEIGSDWLRYPEDYGCLEHRNVRGQQILATKLLPSIKEIMHW